jgi:hypothetical protein
MTALTTTQAIPATDAAESFGARSDAPTLDRQVLTWLRLEGVAALAAGTAVYATLGGDWLWFVPALLLVDLSAIGYLANPRVGAFTYDLFHNWAIGLAVLAVGLAVSLPILALAGAVLIAHVGMDRSVGYGLKLATAFKDTHLGRMGR